MLPWFSTFWRKKEPEELKSWRVDITCSRTFTQVQDFDSVQLGKHVVYWGQSNHYKFSVSMSDDGPFIHSGNNYSWNESHVPSLNWHWQWNNQNT